MITGSFELRTETTATEEQVQSLVKKMNECDCFIDVDVTENVIEAVYNSESISDIEDLMRDSLIISAFGEFKDEEINPAQEFPVCEFLLTKEDGVIKEESPVYLSKVSSQELIEELSNRGIEVSEKGQNKKQSEFTKG